MNQLEEFINQLIEEANAKLPKQNGEQWEIDTITLRSISEKSLAKSHRQCKTVCKMKDGYPVCERVCN